jgi:predicted chitinase
MPLQTRSPYKLPNPGPFLAKVTSHMDTTFMGCLEVALLKGYVNDPDLQSQTFVVNYLSPFYGVTDVRFEGNEPGNFNDVQKSYGMWMIPPDVGSTVMVIFLDGDPNYGFWIGCVLNDRYQNHMVPGIAASNNVQLTPAQQKKYGVNYLPVAELHKRSAKSTINADSVKRAVHPFADILLKQGLLADKVRGVTSSSARREVPSSVFGISTPGRLDPNGPKGQVGYETKYTLPISRKGGHTFVLDDGDQSGDNQLVRIRSSSGHQILLNDSKNLIYIGNSEGTAWIEMTAAGKIDIYAQDSVSIHTSNDFNFRADRDINLEAGRNINVNALGSMDLNVADHMYVVVTGEGKISFSKNLDMTVKQTHNTSVGQSYNLNVATSARITSASDLNLSSEGDLKISTGSSLNLGASGEILQTGSTIHFNGPSAAAATAAQDAQTPSLLPTYRVPATDSNAGWSNGQQYKAGTLTTIMQRVPMHEPWVQHESVNPSAFQAASTDVTSTPRPDVLPTGASAPDAAPPANAPVSSPGICTVESLRAISAPSAQAGIEAVKKACVSAGITNPYAVAAILGIIGGESAWIPQQEGFNYSAEALPVIFAKTFRGKPDLIAKYARWKGTRQEFFDFVYAPENNGSLVGNTQPGDGGKFYGRGFVQLTGRPNYAVYANLTGIDIINNPELLVTDIEVSAKISVAFFKKTVKVDQSDPMYIDNALAAVGGARSGWDKKRAYYECFLANLQGTPVITDTGGTVIDSQGNPVISGSAGG